MTEAVSRTNKPPIIPKTISCFEMMLTAPKEPPRESEPVSPIKIFAGGALNHKKPIHAPMIEPQNTATSPTPSIYGICKY